MKPGVQHYEDKLLEFAYGELPPQEAEAVDAHVRGCTRCAESLSHISSVRKTMSQLPMEPAPTTGLESLMAMAEQQAVRNAAQKPKAAWWRRTLMPLASAMALLVVGVVAWRATQMTAAPDAAAVGLEAQKERRAKEASEELAKDEAKANARVAMAQPVAAAAPAPVSPPAATPPPSPEFKSAPKPEPAPADERSKLAAEKAGSKYDQGYAKSYDKKVELKSDEALGGLGTSDVKESLSRRSAGQLVAPKKEPAPQASKSGKRPADEFMGSGPGAMNNDLAARQRPVNAPPLNEGTSVAQAPEGNAINKGTLSPPSGLFGLRTGSSSGTAGSGAGGVAPGRAAERPSEAAREEKPAAPALDELRKQVPQSTEDEQAPTTKGAWSSKKKPYAPSVKKELAVQPAPTTAAEPPAAAPPPAQANLKAKNSLRLGSLDPNDRSAAAGDDVADGVEQDSDSSRADKDAAPQGKAQHAAAPDRLAVVRDAETRRDYSSVIKLCVQIIGEGAKGPQRAEALRKLCDAYEFIGNPDEAQRYCDQLVSEFPRSLLAQQVRSRRSDRSLEQRAAPAKASKMQFEADESKAKAKAAEMPAAK